ncbi:L,D-transpeptidase family protein [Brevundimonas sp.]|uniref:L,D-transpeptidase family protein n=1 Tax=Brevundimonas sp. TaxID=1871086 RepID=UPI0025C3BD61|nr:L,D-transpeptidase family protein [Brevundimonas sp.]
MERARALPRDMGQRFILVDVASARLWTYENGDPTDEMKVVVGSARQQTPAMAALVRFSVLQPYWNVPEDLAQSRFAPLVLRQGPDALVRQGIETLSDWTAGAHVVDAGGVDWEAVADGRRSQRLRQRPGSANMMGAVKFMFPNNLGIYLHDTPDRSAFSREVRTLSAGCVRLEDAGRLWEWLYGSSWWTVGTGEPEQAAPLADPVPVYILYLTARPDGSGSVVFGADPYGLDSALKTELRLARGSTGVA